VMMCVMLCMFGLGHVRVMAMLGSPEDVLAVVVIVVVNLFKSREGGGYCVYDGFVGRGGREICG
jgi:hypothetical protein